MRPVRLKPHEKAVTIPGPAGSLQAVFGEPDMSPEEDASICVGVLCHPHPLQGGTMENKVVTTMARALHNLNCYTLRFNYRGVEESAGEYGHGVGETEDIHAVIRWVHTQYPTARIALLGFSFGAYVSLQAAIAMTSPAPSFLVSIAPVVGHQAFSDLGAVTLSCPWLVVVGDQDALVSADAIVSWTKHHQPAPAYLVFPDCSHFFHGHLGALREALEQRISAFLQ